MVLNEREATSERALAVEHLSEADLIVNTAQMRDAASLDPFRWTPNALNTGDIIQTAAHQAYTERQRQKKLTEDSSEETSVPTEDSPDSESEPARKRSKVHGQPELSAPAGSHLQPAQQPSGLRHILTAQNDTELPTQQTFTFEHTFQSSFRS